ncbi:hypothetical protein GVN16_10790 [Emticicia sp. CRIBPO]|nr:hypothetical protein [Emticicia sp. CRIBPO]NBA86251.1 hypothetical protein [Emticicia sp. CRIBPO]
MENKKEKTIKVNGPVPERIRKALEEKRDFMNKVQSGEIIFEIKNAKRVL